MRLEFLLVVFVSELRGVLPLLEDELAALRKNDFAAYAALHGMKLTYHEAVTPDGWILQLWRVQSPDIYDAKFSTPVVVSHGFGSSAFDYMRDMRNESTAFILADNGYDVWLTNYRANQFSNWISMDGVCRRPKPVEYYRAAWQYMADLDFPATIDEVLRLTQQSKFYLIGHSMGTTIAFAFLSQNHSYDDKLLHFAAVVPVLKFGNDTSGAIQTSLRASPPVDRLLPQVVFEKMFGRQFLAPTENTESNSQSSLHPTFCFVANFFCELLMAFLLDRDFSITNRPSKHLNKSRLMIYFSKAPAGVTLMNLHNFAQQWGKDPWTKIDFRELPQANMTNEKEYNSADPPKYDFGALKVPFSLFFANNDVFTGPQTARQVIAELNATDVKFVDDNSLSHLDAIVGTDARCYTLNDILVKFEALESKRDSHHRKYRSRVTTHVNKLPFEDGCSDLGRSSLDHKLVKSSEP